MNSDTYNGTSIVCIINSLKVTYKSFNVGLSVLS